MESGGRRPVVPPPLDSVRFIPKQLMNRILISLVLLAATPALTAQEWHPAGDRFKTVWSESIDPQRMAAVYPRPELERSRWLGLDGLWECAVTAAEAAMPERFDEKILVPFVVESSLSGLKRRVDAGCALWYRRMFRIPDDWSGERVLLHLDAVAGRGELFVNGRRAGSFGSDDAPHTFDVAPYLVPSGDQRIIVKVCPETDSVTGLWQSVWLEPVSNGYLTSIEARATTGQDAFFVKCAGEGLTPRDIVEVALYDGEVCCASGRAKVGEEVWLALKSPKRWTPERPFLYTLRVRLYSRRRVEDEAAGYCALRTLDAGRDSAGRYVRLNGGEWFPLGVLDWGWWPDGLLTPPSDEALEADLLQARRLGFNAVCRSRRRMPARWRYHCERVGLVDWHEAFDGVETTLLELTDDAVPDYPRDVREKAVVARYGNIALPLHDHIWNPEKNWGYVKYRTRDEVTQRYAQYAAALDTLAGAGLAGALCVQLTDFEGDVTGLQTADRKALKVDEARVARLNRALCETMNKPKNR